MRLSQLGRWIVTDRIDYLNNAAERVKLAITTPQTEHEVPALVLAQIATAEATLALAEQQRIANLFSAYAVMDRAGDIDGACELWSRDIREGLGLS